MASRKPSRNRDELHVEELDGPEPNANPSSRKGRGHPSVPVRGGAEAGLLQLGGALGLLAGLGLWIGGAFHEGTAEAAASLEAISLHPATLAVAGLMVLAFGRVRRAQVQQARHATGHDDGLLEQVAAAQVHARQSLDRLARAHTELVESLGLVQDRLQALAHGQQALGEQQQALAAQQQAPSDGSEAQEAIFRLAASLDQLGARVEQRMQTQFETFQEGLEQVGEEIVAAQGDLRSLFEQLPGSVVSGEAADPFSEPLPAGEPPAEAPVEVPIEAPAVTAVEPPVETVSQVEEPAAAMPSTDPEPVSSLGVLDEIPDETSEPLPPLRAGTIGPLPEGDDTLEEMAPGVIQKSDVHSPAERAMELDTQTKLTQLKDLLADDRLRSALEDMRRNG